MKTDNEYEQIILGNAVSYSSDSADARSTADYRGATKTMFASLTNNETDEKRKTSEVDFRPKSAEDEDEGRCCENYGVIRDELQTRQYDELFKVISDPRNGGDRSNSIDGSERSNACVDPNSNYEDQDNCIKATVVFIKSAEPKESDYHNYETVSTSFTHTINSSSSTIDRHREPTIRTTPLTVTSCREERCFERIIINEKTLNKIVVPTASTSDAAKSSSGSIDRATIKEHSEDRNNRGTVDRDGSVNRESSAKKNDSPTRNMFVKTKRMIFSPFRRTEDRSKKESDRFDEDRTLRPKGKAKSRSASPKVSRQDVLLRMPLSLPWPLRPSSKEREVRAQAKIEKPSKWEQETSMIEKQDLKRCKIADERTSAFNADTGSAKRKGDTLQISKDEFDNPAQADASVQVAQREPRNRTLLLNNSPLRGNETETESTLRSDSLSSDLIHKLKILSNAAARRDGRTNTISVDPSLESHSSRMRRAKENFLSRRGGPLCYSVLEPQNSDLAAHDLTRTFNDHYETVSENDQERQTRIAELRGPYDREEMENISINEDTEGARDEIMEPRPEASTASRPDLVKSASVGMINVDPDTFGRLAEPNRGCESLPRTISKRRESSGPFAKIVNKFKLSRLIRGKDSAEGNMSTISRLCRQSLLIDVRAELEEQREGDNQDVREELPRVDNNDEIWDTKK